MVHIHPAELNLRLAYRSPLEAPKWVKEMDSNQSGAVGGSEGRLFSPKSGEIVWWLNWSLKKGFWLRLSKIYAWLCHWQCFISRLETWPWTSKAAARSGYDPWSADNWEILIVTIQASAASPPEILLGEETVALGVVHAEGVLKHCVVLQWNLLLLLRSNYSFLLDWRLSSVINRIYTAFESKSDIRENFDTNEYP